MPGCTRWREFSEVSLASCCITHPDIPGGEFLSKCDAECASVPDKSERICCLSDCILKSADMANATGFYDMELTKTKILNIVENNATWIPIVDKILQNCTIEGNLRTSSPPLLTCNFRSGYPRPNKDGLVACPEMSNST